VIRVSELVSAMGARAVGEILCDEAKGFAYDSRADCSGRVFVAVRTDTGDGHDYVEEAAAKGACVALCQYLPDGVNGRLPLLMVPDVMVALADWARAVMRLWPARVIAVTGSLGKTTTKELIATVLRRRWRVAKSPDNLSGRLGLPVAIGEMDRTAKVAVFEVAVDSFGEMRAMAGMISPDVVVVTNVAEPYIEVFGSLGNTAAELSSVLDYMDGDGLAVLNADDERVWSMRHKAPSVISFGLNSGDVRAHSVRVTDDGLQFAVRAEGQEAMCSVGLFAPALVYDCLAAIAVGISAGMSLADCVAALAGFQALPGRANLIQGRGGWRMLDDTFSACPSSVIAALEGLRALPAARRHVVLGGLSSASQDSLRERVRQAVAGAVDKCWAYGDQAVELMKPGRGLRLDVRPCYSLGSLARSLSQSVGEGDMILVAGNRESRLEKLVARLVGVREGIRLVRQEPYWELVRLARPERPTWIELDVEALARNVRCFQQVCQVPVMAVLKADAYGHGAVRVARIVSQNGVNSLGVACLSEAKALREAGIECDILVLGYTPPWQAREAVRHRITCTVFGREEAEALSRAAVALDRIAKVHVKVDTGMARLGLWPEKAVWYLEWLGSLPGLEVEGVFSHFGSADEADCSYARLQLGRFQELLRQLGRAGLRPPVAHIANTAAALTIPESRLDMVRVGIGLFGLRPSEHVALPSGCKPVLSFKTTVAQVKEVPEGIFVGYGQETLIERPTTIAVIPVGYADGFRRSPRNWGEVIIRGVRCPIIGNVCMDQTMVDVTEVAGVRRGDEVVLIGSQGDVSISVDEVACRLGTIGYEVVSGILARVPRLA